MVSISPDGRYLAYNSNETGTYEIYVRPFPSGDGKWQVSTSGGTEPRFTRDGRWLFYRNAGELYGAPVATLSGFVAGAPVQMGAGLGGGGGGNPSSYALSPDGRRILRLKVNADKQERQSPAIVFGWADELSRTRPAKKSP
jgi:serine/threonine-protein kinase